jgi:acyl-CoA hydrolase
MKANYNYVGNSSMIVGIRVESEKKPNRSGKTLATPPIEAHEKH